MNSVDTINARKESLIIFKVFYESIVENGFSERWERPKDFMAKLGKNIDKVKFFITFRGTLITTT